MHLWPCKYPQRRAGVALVQRCSWTFVMKIQRSQTGGRPSGDSRQQRRLAKWCCWGGLNSRPQPYQGCALPLSYSSTPFRQRLRTWSNRPVVRKACAYAQASALCQASQARPRTCQITCPDDMSLSTMTDSPRQPQPPADEARKARLAANLRANLKRRKAQARQTAGPPAHPPAD